MTDYKSDVLDKVSNHQLAEALADIRSNSLVFTEGEIAQYIANIIADDESGNYHFEEGVALLKHWQDSGEAGAKSAAIARHNSLMSIYTAIANADGNKISQMTDVEVGYFDGSSALSTKNVFFYNLLQSNIDVNISNTLRRFNLDDNQISDIVVEFLSGDNNLIGLTGEACTSHGHCSARKVEIYKSILDVYGDKLTTLEGDYSDYLLVEVMDMMFMYNDITPDDIKLVQKLNRAGFLQGINKNYRALSKKIADNTYIKYQHRAKWHTDEQDTDSGLLNTIKSMSNAIEVAEKAVTNSGFEVSSAEHIDIEFFKDSSVSDAATRAFNYEESARWFVNRMSKSDDYKDLNDGIKNSDSPMVTHNNFFAEYRKLFLGVEVSSALSQQEKKAKVVEITSDSEVKDRLVSLMSHFKVEHGTEVEKLCIEYKKQSDMFYVAVDKDQGFPHFKAINNCDAFDVKVTIEGLQRVDGQAESVMESNVKDHELGSVVLDFVALFQPELLGEREAQLLDY